MLKPALIAALATLPLAALPAIGQQVSLTCTLSIICVEISPCSDLEQEIVITNAGAGWRVDWNADLPSDYTEIANIPAPDGSLAPTTLRTLLHVNADTQAVQFISVEEGGNLVLTLHQPQIRPQAVTGFGTCEGMTE
tara:strand:+ start:1449 stop:1859 length:411 start_codon:yes stop_codon:yes gene_type:complete